MTLENFKIDAYYEELEKVDRELADLKRVKAGLEQDIIDNYYEQFSEKLSAKAEAFGTVHVFHGEFDIEYTVSKKVGWDQDKLAEIYEKIKQHEDPSPFIKVKYDVSETNYKNWSEEIQNVFLPARTVKNGTAKLKISKGETK